LLVRRSYKYDIIVPIVPITLVLPFRHGCSVPPRGLGGGYYGTYCRGWGLGGGYYRTSPRGLGGVFFL